MKATSGRDGNQPLWMSVGNVSSKLTGDEKIWGQVLLRGSTLLVDVESIRLYFTNLGCPQIPCQKFNFFGGFNFGHPTTKHQKRSKEGQGTGWLRHQGTWNKGLLRLEGYKYDRYPTNPQPHKANLGAEQLAMLQGGLGSWADRKPSTSGCFAV